MLLNIFCPNSFYKRLMQRILKNLLQNNNSFLLIPNPVKQLDVYYNLYALYFGLSSLTNIDLIVDSYIDRTRFTNFIQQSAKIGDLSTIDINDKNKIIVTLKDLKSDIDGVEWKKTDQGIKLTITTVDQAPAGVKLKYKNSSYDKIILLDFDTEDEINQLINQNPKILKKDNIIILSNNKSLRNENILYTNDNSSIGQQVYSFMKEFNIPINKITALYLIAGMYKGTNNLKFNVNANTFKALADLSNQNVDLDLAIALANNELQQKQQLIPNHNNNQPTVNNKTFINQPIKKQNNIKSTVATTNHVQNKKESRVVTNKTVTPQKQNISTKNGLTQQTKDPLSPATNVPMPIRFEKVKEVVHPNTPLQAAHT